MTNGLSGPRKQFLDVLRVLATCAVVLMHVLTGATDVTDASIEMCIRDSSWAVPT